MRKIVLFLLALAMMTMLCCCIKDGTTLGEKNSAETSDVAASANNDVTTTADADATGSGDKETTTSPLETGTTSPDPENDSNWTDNY